MTKIIGITGGIGSGKSTLSKLLLKKGFGLHDSDMVVKKIYQKPSKKFISFLIKQGLKKTKAKTIDKKYISKIIFSDNKIKKNLEKFIFDIVRKNREEFIKKHKIRKTETIFIDVPLLFENELDYIFDKIICVITKRKLRYQRLKKSKKMSETLFKNILKAQTSDKSRKERSDILIYNNSSLKNYYNKINKVIEKITL